MPALETIALNLAATGLSAGGSRSAQKVQSLLRERRFSDEIDDLETEFNTLLRDQLFDALDETDRLSVEEVKHNWEAVATELDEISVVFETEEEAISRITSAIAAGLGYNINSNPQLQEEIAGAVASVYRDVLRTFENKIAGTELADRLSQRADIELTNTINEVATRLEDIERRQRQRRDANLRQQGFVSVSSLYFERKTPESPARCWRTGFELAEVNAGYAIEREAERDNGSRYRLADNFVEQLRNGTDCVILGPPGSGKSTICKQVACRWHDEGGPVFYWASDKARSLSDWRPLEECIKRTKGEVLVVVEDAIRDEAVDIFHAIETLRHDPDVAFLLDSRESEWHGSDAKLTDARLQEIKESELHHITVPRVDKRECERIVEHFEATTDAQVSDTPAELFEQINTASGVSEILQLSYHLSFYAAGATNSSPHSEGITSLEKSVQTIIDRQQSDDEDLSLELGVLINLLNATDIGAHPELLHGLAKSETDHRIINTVLKRYEGTLVFLKQSAAITDQIEPLRTNHEFWSTLYLQELLNLVGERKATRLFETCLDRLFTLVDDTDRRAEINRWFRQEMPFFTELEAAPTETADSFIERLFDLGRRQPALAPLYGTTKFTSVDPPAVCSADIPVRMALWRGIMYYNGGNFDAAEEEFEAARELLNDRNELSIQTANEIEGWCLNYLGAIQRKRGEVESARERHRRSQNQFQEIDEKLGVAFSLYNIGKVYRVKSDLDAAQRHLEDALDIFRETGDSRYVSITLNNLGLVLRDKGQLMEAEERLRQSRENAREVGDERSEGRCLNHLGTVKMDQGKFDSADEHYRRALKLARKIGDKQCQAWSVHNIGDIAYKRGDLESATEYFGRAKKLDEEIGNRRGIAIALNYMAEINCDQGEYDLAADQVAEGLDIVRDVGDRHREAELLKTQGIIEKNRGQLDQARDALAQALGIFEAIGDSKSQSESLVELGTLALKQRDLDRAEQLLKDALDIIRSINDREGEVRALGGLGSLAQHRGDLATAEDHYQESHTIATEIEDREGEAYSLGLLGELARKHGDLDRSRTLLAESQSLFAEIGDRRRQAKIDRQRALTALAADDISKARDLLLSALKRFDEIGDEMGYAAALADRGQVAHADGNVDEAISDLRTAIKRFREIGATEIALEHVEAILDIRDTTGTAGTDLQSLVHELRQEVASDNGRST
jgi:tetratricopeptide (TPR) repeat protein